ncbi:MAG: T9SS type A sorting domain-containing protein [Bacteroidota bacterium]
MKKQYLFLVLGAFLTGLTNAQTTVTDSIETGAAYANDIYYSLATGKVATVANSNWNLAFSIGNANVSVRANTGVSTTSNGKTVIYGMPGTDVTKWSTFDTAGYKTGTTKWIVLNNSDQDWQEGALNYVDTNDMINYDNGWGAYDISTHVVTGIRLYMAVVTNGTSTLYKKIWVQNKTLGTWKVSFANLDGTDSVGLSIASTTYTTKNFAYVSLVTGQIVDREAAKTDWDFIYTRYLPNTPGFPVSTGILTNAGVITNKVTGKEETTTTLADTTTFSSSISAIGANWKSYNFNTNAYTTADSVSYFIKAKDGAFWKLVFTGFVANLADSSRPGRAIFNKTKLTPSTGVLTLGEDVKNVSVYPNPTSNVLNVLFEANSANSTVVITDITGKQVYSQQVESSSFTNHSVDVSNFTKGIYFLSVVNGNSRSVQKVVVN